jgi:hypothetical protein
MGNFRTKVMGNIVLPDDMTDKPIVGRILQPGSDNAVPGIISAGLGGPEKTVITAVVVFDQVDCVPFKPAKGLIQGTGIVFWKKPGSQTVVIVLQTGEIIGVTPHRYSIDLDHIFQHIQNLPHYSLYHPFSPGGMIFFPFR